MAKNPFVDGITNLAIPDSPYGVYLKGVIIPGSLFGIEAAVEGDANLQRMDIRRHVKIDGMRVGGVLDWEGTHIDGGLSARNVLIGPNLYLNKMEIGDCLSLEGARGEGNIVIGESKIRGNVDLRDITVRYLGLRDSHFEGSVSLGGAEVETLRISETQIKWLVLEDMSKTTHHRWVECSFSLIASVVFEHAQRFSRIMDLVGLRLQS